MLVVLSSVVGSSLACVSRSDAITRAMEWVDKNIPYNANAYYKGYVQGCEGIVGYAWLFPTPGVYSGDLESKVCKRISKGQLQMGDIMVNPGHHQLLFHSWTNSDKTEYWAIELGGAPGSRKYKIPWPYWSNDSPQSYFPCKVDKACVSQSNPFEQTS